MGLPLREKQTFFLTLKKKKTASLTLPAQRYEADMEQSGYERMEIR